MPFKILHLKDAGAWDEALQSVGGGDIYYRREYVAALKNRGEGNPILIVAGQDQPPACHVTLVREIPEFGGNPSGSLSRDLISPYGYSGPLLKLSSLKGAEQFLSSWTEAAEAVGAVSEFVRFHPLLRTQEKFLGSFDVMNQRQTVSMNLKDTDVSAGLSTTCRKNLGTALKKAVKTEIGGSEMTARFMALYSLAMKRLGAGNYYHFEMSYFEDLASGLGKDFIIAIATHDGHDVAAALALRHGPFLHYHLGGADYAHRALCPTNLLLVRLAEYGKELGCSTFHLGGGVAEGDTLFGFKAGFSHVRHEFAVGRIIFRKSEYDRLTKAHQQHGEVSEGYFPRYRAPLIASSCHP